MSANITARTYLHGVAPNGAQSDAYRGAAYPKAAHLHAADRAGNYAQSIQGTANQSPAKPAPPSYPHANQPPTSQLQATPPPNRYAQPTSTRDPASSGMVLVATQSNPAAVVVSRDSDKYYIANRTSNSVTVVCGRTLAAKNIAVGIDPMAIAINRTTDRIYVATNTGNITVIEGQTNTVVTSILTGTPMIAIAVNPVTNTIYAIASSDLGTISVIDGANNNVIATLAAGIYPSAVGINIITNQIYVVNQFSDSITVVDGHSNTVVDTVGLRKNAKPRAVVINAACNKVYVANAGTPGFGISIIDGASLHVRNVPVGRAFEMAFNTVTNKIYIATLDYATGANAVTVVNAETEAVETVIPMPCFTSALKVEVGSNKIYIANQAADTLTVIDGNTHTIIAQAPTGSNPIAIAVNPITHKVVIANFNHSSVTVIAPDAVEAVGNHV